MGFITSSSTVWPWTDVSLRNLFVTDSCSQWATSFLMVSMSFEGWCNPSPRVSLCQITWTTRMFPMPRHVRVMVTWTGIGSHWREHAHSNCWHPGFACRAASITYKTWKCVPSSCWIEGGILTLGYTRRFQSSLQFMPTSGALYAPVGRRCSSKPNGMFTFTVIFLFCFVVSILFLLLLLGIHQCHFFTKRVVFKYLHYSTHQYPIPYHYTL